MSQELSHPQENFDGILETWNDDDDDDGEWDEDGENRAVCV